MKLIKAEKIDKQITEKYYSEFTLADDGLYLIEIIVSAKSWRQNLKSFKSLFKDDDLSLTLDRIEITTSMSNKTDVRPAWNGNELKGFLKTVVIAVKLKKGKHALKFTPDQSPYLKSITISQVEEINTLIYIPTDNNPPQKGDIRPWLSFIIVNLAIKDLIISAKADKRGRDDDDIKLIIDGETPKNQDKKSHQDWYWCGKVSKGEKKEFKKSVNFNGGLHTIDLWADESPYLEKIELVLAGDVKFEENKIKQYGYKGVNGQEDYNKFDGAIAAATDHWNNEFLHDTDPPEEALDQNLVKAMAFQESRVGNDKTAGINIMRVGVLTDPSLRTLKGELKEYWIHQGKRILLKYDNAIINEEADSIYWGVRWLYHKAQWAGDDGQRRWFAWKEAVKRYGPGTQKYVNNVWNIYLKGVDGRTKPPLKLWTIAFLIIFSSLIFYAPGFSEQSIKSAVLAEMPAEEKAYINDIEITRYATFSPLFLAVMVQDEDWWESLRVGIYQNGLIRWLTMETEPFEGSILEAKFLRLKGFSNPLVEVYGQTHAGHGAMYLYEVESDRLALLFQTTAVDFNIDSRWAPENYKKYGFGYCGEVFAGGWLESGYEDLNNDNIIDIKLSGTEEIICEKEFRDRIPDENYEVKVASVPVGKIFLWDKSRRGWKAE